VQSAIQELNNILKEQYQKCFNKLQDLEGQSKQFQNSFHLSWFHAEEKIKNIHNKKTFQICGFQAFVPQLQLLKLFLENEFNLIVCKLLKNLLSV
jgi:hypothetical protein